MTLPFTLDGALVVIPGIYDILRVQASLPAPVAAGRSVLVLGESDKGVPGTALNLALNFYTDFQSVKDYYGTGSIVDSARQLFQPQPSPVFSGAVQRMYVYKTNATTRASKLVASPTGYGTIFAGEYGEDGNMVKSQIHEFSEVLASKTFEFMPAPAARTVKVSLNGVISSISLAAFALSPLAGSQTQLATALTAITGLTVTGGTTARNAVAAPITSTALSVSTDGEVLTLVATGGTFAATIVPGDTVTIPAGTALSGGSDENAGAFTVMSASASQLVIRKVVQWSATAVVPFVACSAAGSPVLLLDNTMIEAWGPLSVAVSAASPAGVAQDLEFASPSGAPTAVGELADVNGLLTILASDMAAVGSVTATSINTIGLTVTLTNAQWSQVPVAGDVVRIRSASTIAGALKQNVGLHVVVSATSTSLTLASVNALPTASVALTALSGDTQVVLWGSGFVSSTFAPITMKSASERSVWVEASNIKTGATWPTTAVGGQVLLEVGYWDGVATTATLDINAQGVMTIAAGLNVITVRLNKYPRLQNLVDFLNTQTGVAARIPDNRSRNVSPMSLDQVQSMGILGDFTKLSYNGRVKGDYQAWVKFFSDNFGLLSFAVGPIARKAGLPTAEATVSFLSGAVIGGTTDASVQAGLDQGLKVDVRNVLPCFSRDALDDVNDGLTDTASSYTIAATHAAVKAHCAAAATIKVKRERFGMLSIHESFQNAMQIVSNLGYERLQMTFQLVNTIGGDGALAWFMPWMSAACIAAGRSQSALGTSMLRKPFNMSNVKHIGKKSLFDDTLVQDFDPEDVGQLEQAIEAGLVCFRAVAGFGIRMESPDLSTRSRVNDPEGWVWERCNVLFTLDEVRQTVRTLLDNFIGSRQSDVSTAVIKEAIRKALATFVTGGSLLNAVVDDVKREGFGYRAFVRVIPTEALEFITLDILAERAPTG